MAASVEATTREMGQSLINPDKPSDSASALPGDTEKPAFGPKPHLIPKPFSLQRNATVRPIRAPKTNFNRQLHRAASSETLLNTRAGGVETLDSNGTVNGSDQSAAPKPVPLSPKPDLQAKPKPELTKSLDITGSNNQTDSKPDATAEEMKNVQPRSRAKSLGAQDHKILNQKAEGEAGDTEADVKVRSRCWPARNRLSMELTSKFESPAQPEQEVNTVRSKTEKEGPPHSPSTVSEPSKPPEEKEDAGDEDVVGGSIKRRISLLFDRSAASQRRDTFNKRDVTPAEISIDIKQRIQNLSLPSTGAPKSPPFEKTNEKSSERPADSATEKDKQLNTTEIKNSAANVENEEEEEDDEGEEDKENYVTAPVYRRVGISIDMEKKRTEKEEKQRKDEQLEKERQQQEKERLLEEERKAKEIQKQQEEERKQEEEKLRQMEERRKQEEEWKRKIEEERKVEERRRQAEKERERQREQERLEKERQIEEEKRRIEKEKERQIEEERLRQEKLEKEREMEEEKRRIQEMERQKEEERMRKEQEMERIRKEKEMEEERRRIQEMERQKEEERLRKEREKEEQLKKEKEMEEERLKEKEKLRQEREKEERLKKEREMEEERRRIQEMERQKEEERLRKEREMERIRKEKEMEEERQRVQEMERQKEKERLRKEQEKEERLKKDRQMEEERRKIQEMERQKEEERLRKEQEMERIKKERETEERKRMEEERQREEERLRQEGENNRLKEKEMETCKAVERLREEVPTSYDLISFDAEEPAASPTLVSPQLTEVLYDDFSVKPRRWGTGPRRSSTPSPSRELLAAPDQNLQPESKDPGSQEPHGDQVNVHKPEASSAQNSTCKDTESREQTSSSEEETESKPEDLLVPETQSDEGQLKDCEEPEEDGVAEPDTENLIDETDEQSENHDTVDGIGTESRVNQVLKRLTRRNTSESHPPDVPAEEEPELLPVLEAAAPLLDSSVLRSKVDLSKKRSIKRSRPTRAVRQRDALPALTEGTNPDWRFCDSTDAKVPCSNGGDSESEEEPSRDVTSPSAPSHPKRVPMFPGMDPSALMAQLKRRSGVVEAESPPEAPPSVPKRSPRTPTMSLGPRVLPPVDAKDSGSGSSPSWLLELKSKKRTSQPESEA